MFLTIAKLNFHELHVIMAQLAFNFFDNESISIERLGYCLWQPSAAESCSQRFVYVIYAYQTITLHL